MSKPDMKQYAVGDDFFGWTLMGWIDMPYPGMDMTRGVFFRQDDPSIDDADEVLVFNGQGVGPVFCIRNGRVDICPRVLSGLASQTT